MGRSNLPFNNQEGYTIVKIANGTATFSERLPSLNTTWPSWAKVELKQIPKDSIVIQKPDYSITTFPNVNVKWEYDLKTDICGGFSIGDKTLYSGTFDGHLLAINKATGTEDCDGKIVCLKAGSMQGF